MKKSVTKRIKVTKTGKLLRRKMAINHFRSKKTGKQIRHKKQLNSIASGYQKEFQKYITVR